MDEAYKADYLKLVEFLMPVMENNIKKYPGIVPVGSSMDLEGKCNLVSAYPGENASLDEVEELILAGLRQAASAQTIRACAVGYSCSIIAPNTTRRTDALAIKMEHRHIPPEITYFTYKKTWLGIQFESSFAISGKTEVFSKGDLNAP